MPHSSDALDPSDEKSTSADVVKQGRTRRRVFLKRCLGSAVGLGLAGLGYSLFEAGWIRVHRTSIVVPRLPTAFQGMTVAFLSDIHHGPFTSLEYVQRVVELTNSLSPDVVLLGGRLRAPEPSVYRSVFQSPCAAQVPMGQFWRVGQSRPLGRR